MNWAGECWHNNGGPVCAEAEPLLLSEYNVVEEQLLQVNPESGLGHGFWVQGYVSQSATSTS